MRGTSKVSTRLLFAIFCLLSVFIIQVNGSQAFGGCSCGGVNSIVSREHSETRDQVCDCYNNRMDQHEDWILNDFWPLMEEALKGSASQNSQGQATTLQAQSMMHDADNHIATQRTRESEVVQTMRRYGGAEYAVCTPASVGQGAIASREIARGYASAIASATAKNRTGSTSGRSANGGADDRVKRFGQACATYIESGSYGGLASVLGCSASDDTANLDISMTEIFSGRDLNGDNKIDADDFFDGTNDGGEEEAAMTAFKSNLGLYRPFPNIRKDKASSNKASVVQVIMAMRQYEARRSVAEMAFNVLESELKPASAAAVEYLRGLYTEMGRDNVDKLIPSNPSVYAQEKAIYYDYHMDPNLYIQDYTDAPEQVARHQVVALSQINAQLFRITQVLKRIELGIAGSTISELDGEYNRISSAVNSINTSR